MQKILLLFDENIDCNQLSSIAKFKQLRDIYFFPLTSNWNIINKVENACRLSGNSDLNIVVLNSAEFIDNEVNEIKGMISSWASNLGDYIVWNKPIKKWFLTPQKEVSTWWFSLIAEKNNLKTNVFFNIAQVNAIEKLLKSKEYNFCYLVVRDNKFKRVLKKILTRYKISFRLLASVPAESLSFKDLTKMFLENIGILSDIINSFIALSKFILESIKARKIMGQFNERKKQDRSILFVSYFPAVDKLKAEEGIFRNKYAIPLQDRLNNKNQKINWLLMYVPIDGWSYDDALKLGSKFSRNNESIFFLHEFISIRVVSKVIFVWLIQLIKYFLISIHISHKVLTPNLTIKESHYLLYPVWRRSFVGVEGIEGIIYFEVFKEVFKYFINSEICIYYAEMHAWEKALNSAAMLINGQIKTIGFQHTTVAANYFFYLSNPTELKRERDGTDLPLPNVIACNGCVGYEKLKKEGFPNLKKVEALRQLYLLDYLQRDSDKHQKENVLLVAGSIDRLETSRIVSLINSAFPESKTFKIWLKGHPAMPVEDIVDQLHIDTQKCGYEIKHDPIDKLLAKSRIVLTGASTVSIEALAFGCKVVLPVFSDKMFMSPLSEFDDFYEKIYNPNDLRDVVIEQMESDNIVDMNLNKNFILKYWCLNESLKQWEDLLEL
ncbi:MAG: hypothetical protein A2W05_00085 [Candidatus Schekmanbacteria bacterium RBG_16_38_10]|uniref:Uncharacterized protein n=1 Tax=Candidatus Schekmanbacteria bacterium RBG_16_38_10 TaxID=1817879 RepID=A0A1F7S1X2_9BACT|nr:MAG: hypothetical protein A2W05_00085 [Candidatus Schekmanbacteria bacterium RBG_16_38_10]